MKYQTQKEQQTIELGKKLAKKVHGGEVILLSGDLGSGKTVLVKGFAKGLGIKKIITSPTFVLFKIYNLKRGRIKTLVHVDCYRVGDGREILEVGLSDYLGKKDTLVIVEWGEKIKPYIKTKNVLIKFKTLTGDKRSISVT